MAKRFTLDRFCCLSLSRACIVFGLVDLVVNICVTVICAKDIHEKHDNGIIIFLIITIIGICTCLLMMIGSRQKNHWLLLPNITWATFRIGFNIVIVLMSIITVLANGNIIKALVTFIVGTLILLISILYWNIIYSRFVEIKKKQSTPPPEDIEIE